MGLLLPPMLFAFVRMPRLVARPVDCSVPPQVAWQVDIALRSGACQIVRQGWMEGLVRRSLARTDHLAALAAAVPSCLVTWPQRRGRRIAQSSLPKGTMAFGEHALPSVTRGCLVAVKGQGNLMDDGPLQMADDERTRKEIEGVYIDTATWLTLLQVADPLSAGRTTPAWTSAGPLGLHWVLQGLPSACKSSSGINP